MSRSSSQRITDTLRRFESDANVWVATASPQGVPHLVPLSLAWDGSMIVVATPMDAPTVRNVTSTGRARASLDSAVDVVIVDTTAAAAPFEDAAPELIQLYVARVGWDPRDESGSWALVTLVPRLVYAWRGLHEIDGRTIMHRGQWITD